MLILTLFATKVPGTDGKAPNKGFDDKEGCYRFVTHDHIAYRYVIIAVCSCPGSSVPDLGQSVTE